MYISELDLGLTAELLSAKQPKNACSLANGDVGLGIYSIDCPYYRSSRGGVTCGVECTDGVHARVLAVQVCKGVPAFVPHGGVMQQMQSCHGTNMCG